MNRRTFLTAASSAVASAALAAPVPRAPVVYDLLLWEKGDPDCRLLRVPVRDGKPGKPKPVADFSEPPRISDTPSHVHADRYLITFRAAVIDLTTQKVLHQPKGVFLLGVDGGRVVYRNWLGKEKDEYFVFDLTKQTVAEVNKPGRWELPGVVSPDGKRSVTAELSGELTLHTADGTRTALGGGFKADLSPLSSFLPQPPVVWAGDDHVVSQVGNGQVVVVNVADGKKGDTIAVPAKVGLSVPTFTRDTVGNVLYDGGSGLYRLDLKAGTAEKYEWRQMGHQFQVAVTPAVDGFAVRHGDKGIGNVFGLPMDGVTAPWHFAFLESAREGYTVRVWTTTGGWGDVPVKVAGLIGWVKG
jgi:hypothetical protein